MWLDVREGTHLVSSRAWPQSHMGSEKMELTLAHEIRARAIACTPLGCIGARDTMRSLQERAEAALSVRNGGLKLCCPERQVP